MQLLSGLQQVAQKLHSKFYIWLQSSSWETAIVKVQIASSFSKLPSATSISLLQGSISWQESIFVSSILTALQTAHTTRRKHFHKAPQFVLVGWTPWINFFIRVLFRKDAAWHISVSLSSTTTWCKVNSDYLCFSAKRRKPFLLILSRALSLPQLFKAYSVST